MRVNSILLILLVVGFTSCVKQLEDSINYNDSVTSTLSLEEAQITFVRILSSAVANSEDLRVFLKAEALKKFDLDYDVFYPLTKNLIVDGSSSFRDILLMYTDERTLLEIEESLPTLTIMVPDFSWVSSECFNVKTWDTSLEYVAVSYDDSSNYHQLYYCGELLGNLPVLSYPSFPTLIVKSNERIVANHDTKSGGLVYSFVDPYFDNSKNTKASTIEGDLINGNAGTNLVSVDGDYVSHSLLYSVSPETVYAYNYFGLGYGVGCQRDFIYYGMTSSSNSGGILNPFEKELLYRFSMSTAGLYAVSGLDDPNISEELHTGRGDRPEFDEAVRRLWGNGDYEIRIDVYRGVGNSYTRVKSIPFSLSPNQVMYISKCHYTFTWNFFGNNWSVYSIEASDIQPKWVYVHDDDIPLCLINDGWNLFGQSDNIWLSFSEYDNDTTISTTREVTFKNTTNVQFGSGSDATLKTSLGVTGEDVDRTTCNISVVDGSDSLGDCYVNYIDNVITNFTGDGYYLRRYGTPLFSFSLIPCDVRNEYSIRQTLRNRR